MGNVLQCSRISIDRGIMDIMKRIVCILKMTSDPVCTA